MQTDQVRDAAKAERNRQADIQKGMGYINGQYKKFDDTFYNNISNAYMDYAKPQLDFQKSRDEEQTRFSLARNGILDSSAGARKFADLSQMYGGLYTDAASRAQQTADQKRGEIESNRNQVIAQLYASQSPQIALQSAQRSSVSNSAMPSFEPVTDLLDQASKFAARDYSNAAYGTGNGRGFTSGFYQQQNHAPSATGGASVIS